MADNPNSSARAVKIRYTNEIRFVYERTSFQPLSNIFLKVCVRPNATTDYQTNLSHHRELVTRQNIQQLILFFLLYFFFSISFKHAITLKTRSPEVDSKLYSRIETGGRVEKSWKV